MWVLVQVLVVVAAFYFGALFGAWIVESDQKRRARARKVPLMELANDPDAG